MAPQAKTRVFISFDYDHDQALKNLLIGQARHERSPFSVEDWSIKQASTAWKSDARDRIRRADQVIVICGYTRTRPWGSALSWGLRRKRRNRTSSFADARTAGSGDRAGLRSGGTLCIRGPGTASVL